MPQTTQNIVDDSHAIVDKISLIEKAYNSISYGG